MGVRFRQVADSIRHRLFFVPLLFVVAGLLLSLLTLRVDSSLVGRQLPSSLQTTVDSGRSMLTTIAGGLISTVTLLLTLMLVAVQLASSQFSPRTVRDWVGDKTQQVVIGFVMGTIVYCLLILRGTRDVGAGDELIPHISVLVGLALAILSLLAVVRAVDHLTNRLRVESVGSKLATDTVALIESSDRVLPAANAGVTPAYDPNDAGDDQDVPTDAVPIIGPESGWIQQVDQDKIFDALPEGATIHLATTVGSFTLPHAPLAYLAPSSAHEEHHEALVSAIAVGDTRTMQQDIGFGILQMTDIAIRALSPGINDPNTANDMLMHISVVLLALWERPIAPTVARREGKTIFQPAVTHADYLAAAFEPIRHYGRDDSSVMTTMTLVLESLMAEVERRELPGPIDPIANALAALDTTERV